MTNITEILWQKINANSDKIENFFSEHFSKKPANFYNSCDLRNSGFKIAPVDTNCFPAGFNNLSQISLENAQKIADDFFNKNFPDAKKIIIVPENHTRNLRYLENLLAIQKIIGKNREVIIGTLLGEVKEKVTIEINESSKIELEPLVLLNDKIATKDGFVADLIILNNDLTDGIPQILENTITPIIPTINLGWFQRIKSNHFTIYNDLASKLASIINIDPWLISTIHDHCDDVNFKEQKGMDSLVKYVDSTIAKIKEKYQEYGISDEPYVYVKADNGTYGMAIWAISSGQEILEINKKNRNKMHMIKGSVQNTKIMIQEGVKTIDRINDNFAEPMIYSINGNVIGNLFRVNETRDEKTSLNSTGATFFDLTEINDSQINLGLEKEKITAVYGLVAKLASLASSYEI